jgi:hypothetical protein
MSVAPLIFLALAAQDGIRVEPLSSFDGKKWSGLILGEQRDPDLKRLFKAGKGSVRGEGMLVPTRGSTGVRVDALLDGRGAKATLQAIRVEYKENAPSIEDLVEELKEEPEVRFQTGRWEDWALLAFPNRGIIAVLKEVSRDRPVIDAFFLARPNAVKEALGSFSREETDVVEVPDPGFDWDRVVGFGEIEVQINQDATARLPADLTERSRDRLQDRVEDWLRDLRRGPVVYDRLSRGRYLINVRLGAFNDKGESRVSYSAKLNAGTPYGPIEVSAGNNRTIKDRYLTRISDDIEDLMDMIDRNTVERVRKLGPPPANQKRDQAVEDLMDRLTGVKR